MLSKVQLRFLFLTTLLLLYISGSTQVTSLSDSLFGLLNEAQSDTEKVKRLNELSYSYLNINPDLTEKYAEDALLKSLSVEYSVGEVNSYFNLGMSSYMKGNYYKSLDFHTKGLKKAEDISYQKGEADACIGIGLVYLEQAMFQKALEFFNKSLSKYKSCKSEIGEGHAYNMLGISYYKMVDYEKADEYYSKTLEIADRINDKALLVSIYQDLGNLYARQRKYPLAISTLKKSLEVAYQLPSEYHICFTLVGLGKTYAESLDDSKAESSYNEVIRIAKEADMKPFLEQAYLGLSQIYKSRREFDKAFETLSKYLAYHDSLSNKQVSIEITRLGYLLENERKGKQMELMEKKALLKEKELRNRKYYLFALLIALLVLFLIVFLVFRQYRSKQLANKTLSDKNEEINKQQLELRKYNGQLEEQQIILKKQSELIASKNKDITDSIQYAMQIQKAILPDRLDFLQIFNDVFCLYLPKDIVSGDFYWCYEKNNSIYIAAGDCTGHGIPGAFMSILGINHLNHILEDETQEDVAEILLKLDKAIIQSLKQFKEEAFMHDGMDISLCRINKDNFQLDYVAARRPLYYFKDGVFNELQPSHFPIGGFHDENKDFLKHKIQLGKGDKVYLFTDGYADQFGGPKNKKIMTKNLKNLIKQIKDLPMCDQEEALMQHYMEWKGSREQIDDVLIIGIKL